jgi:hypothetical protein
MGSAYRPNPPNDERFVEGEDFVGTHDAFLWQPAQFEILGDQPHGRTIAQLRSDLNRQEVTLCITRFQYQHRTTLGRR